MMSMARGVKAERVPTPINDLVRDFTKLTLQDRRLRNQDSKISINFDLDPEAGMPVVARHSIGQVIINLVSNAIDALVRERKEREPTYRPTINLRTKALGEKVAIEIHDNGGGINREDIEHIFDSFYTTKECGNGNMGLGLAISQGIVENDHHGSLRVESEKGEFTKFIIELPL
jgi:signal transduction histidine kinase